MAAISLAVSQNKKYEPRTSLALKRQKWILTILPHQTSFEAYVICTVASLTKNSLNQPEIGVFIYTTASLILEEIH